MKNKRRVVYTHDFVKGIKKLPSNVQKLLIAKEKVLLDNPFEPSLKTHALKGRLVGTYAFSINYAYRVIFGFDGDTIIIFFAVGTHEVYK